MNSSKNSKKRQLGGSLHIGRRVIRRKKYRGSKAYKNEPSPIKRAISSKTKLQRDRSDFFSKVKMRANIVIPFEATHSSLHLFEKPPLLVTFDQAFG